MRLSPGAASDWISPSSVSGAKPTAGSHFVRDRFNGETPMHGHRYMTLRRGSRSSLGERAALLSRGTALRLPEQQYCCRLILKVGQLTGLPGLTRLSHFMIPVETGTPPGDYFESMPQNKMMCDVRLAEHWETVFVWEYGIACLDFCMDGMGKRWFNCGRPCPSCAARSRGRIRPWQWNRACHRASCLGRDRARP